MKLCNISKYNITVIAVTLILAFSNLAAPQLALAVRPFVTDDARVVGDKLFLLETSLKGDNGRLQNLNLLAYGPSEKLELTVGFVDGFPLSGYDKNRFSIGGALGQAKYLITEGTANGLPGVAVIGGFGAPYGTNSFKGPSWSQFGYLAFTESLGEKERVLIHANIGVNNIKVDDKWSTTATWGIGTQIRMIGGLHYVGEVFHGDPYAGDSGWAFQTGLRHFISEQIQLDATVGSGFAGNNQPKTFVGCGPSHNFRFALERQKVKYYAPCRYRLYDQVSTGAFLTFMRVSGLSGYPRVIINGTRLLDGIPSSFLTPFSSNQPRIQLPSPSSAACRQKFSTAIPISIR